MFAHEFTSVVQLQGLAIVFSHGRHGYIALPSCCTVRSFCVLSFCRGDLVPHTLYNTSTWVEHVANIRLFKPSLITLHMCPCCCISSVQCPLHWSAKHSIHELVGITRTATPLAFSFCARSPWNFPYDLNKKHENENNIKESCSPVILLIFAYQESPYPFA